MGLVDFVVYLLVGSFAGVLAGLLGVGGGIVIVPVLLWVFRANGIDESVVAHLAIGSSLGTIIFTSVSSIRAHHRHDAILWRQVYALAPGIVIGAWLGAAIADQMPTQLLQRVFALFAISVSLQMWTGARPSEHRKIPGRTAMNTAGSVIGAVSAIVGIGGGSLTVPFLSWCGVNIRNAVATSAACGLPIALAGAVGFVVTGLADPLLPTGSFGYLYLPAVFGVVLASFMTAPIGARLAHRIPVATLKRFFALLLGVVGVKLLIG